MSEVGGGGNDAGSAADKYIHAQGGTAAEHPGEHPNDAGVLESISNRNAPFTNPPLRNPPQDFWNAQLFRGWIMEAPNGAQMAAVPGQVPAKVNKINELYRLNFLYNPGTVNHGWDIDTSLQPPRFAADQTNPYGSIALSGITLSFNLFFDRRRVGDRQGNAKSGVLSDVRILSKILTAGQGGPGTPVNVGSINPVWCVLGRAYDPLTIAVGRPYKPLENALTCIGYITSANVNYTIFDPDMTPIQCEMSLSIYSTLWMPDITQINPSIGVPSTRSSSSASSGKSRRRIRRGNTFLS